MKLIKESHNRGNCSLCHKPFMRRDVIEVGPDHNEYHEHCYNLIKNKLEQEFKKQGLWDKVKRFFYFHNPRKFISDPIIAKQWGIVLQNENKQIIRNVIREIISEKIDAGKYIDVNFIVGEAMKNLNKWLDKDKLKNIRLAKNKEQKRKLINEYIDVFFDLYFSEPLERDIVQNKREYVINFLVNRIK